MVGIIWTAEYFRTCRLFHLQNQQIQDLKSYLNKMQDSTTRASQRTAGCDIEHTSQELRDDTNENNTKEKNGEENGTKEKDTLNKDKTDLASLKMTDTSHELTNYTFRSISRNDFIKWMG